jgi:hypothetical protein
MRPGTLTDKLAAIGRRAPKDLQAIEVLTDFVLDRLDAAHVSDPAAHVWKCDQNLPPVWKPGDKPKKGGA